MGALTNAASSYNFKSRPWENETVISINPVNLSSQVIFQCRGTSILRVLPVTGQDDEFLDNDSRYFLDSISHNRITSPYETVRGLNTFIFRGLNNGDAETKFVITNLRGEAKMKMAQIFVNRYKDSSFTNQKELSTTYISPNLSDTTKWHLRTNNSIRNLGMENIDYTTYCSLMSVDAAEMENDTEVKKLPVKTGIKKIISSHTVGSNMGGRVRYIEISHPFHLYKLNRQWAYSSLSVISSHYPLDDNNHVDHVIPGILPVESLIEDEFTSLSNGGKTQQAKFVAIGNPKMAIYDQRNISEMSEIIRQILQTSNPRSSSHRLFSISHKKAMRNNQSLEGSTNLTKRGNSIRLTQVGNEKPHTVVKGSLVTLWSKSEITVLTANSGLLKKACLHPRKKKLLGV
jgi:hypothetical protein